MKKILSLLLVMTMLITHISVFATDENTSVTAYVTVSIYGEFAKCIDGNAAIFLPVELDGKPSYTLDDLFSETHKLFDYAENYESQTGDFGAYITKFWGDESGNFGYQVNGGEESVMDLYHTVENGDYVDVAIYKSMYPDTESYTKFNIYTAETDTCETVELTLLEARYDENWNTIFSPCQNALITIDGTETDILTDVDGKATLSFETAGTYIISATKEKTVNEENVPAITSPVCKINVSEPEYMTVINNIAEKYSDTTITSDGNMVWFIADIAVYNELYPKKQIAFTSKVKQACLDKIITDADEATAPSALAKNIIALRAMGYDAKNVYNSKSNNINIVKKLTDLVDAQNEAVINIYTLPYVIIALRQGEDYATPEQMDYLINAALSSKEAWQNNEWGTDAISAMLLALAPYYTTNEDVKNACDEALEVIINSKDENGLIDNAASTGLAITALSSFGKDSMELGVIDGLLTLATESLDGFEPMENSFSTEQGFRGLLAWQLLTQNTGSIMYDFSSYPTKEARSTKKSSSGGGGGGGSYKPVVKDEKPKTEEKVEDKTEKEVEETVKSDIKNPDVKMMTVSAKGKTFEDIKNNENTLKIEALAQRGIINGKTENSFEPASTMTRAEFATIITRGLGLPEKAVAGFADVKESDWFFKYINTAYSYGIIRGISDTEFNPNGVITRQEAAVMMARASKLCGIDTEISEDDARDTLALFTDYTTLESWAKNAVAFCLEKGIILDEGTEIVPLYKVTRAEVASMVYNMLEKSSLLQEE